MYSIFLVFVQWHIFQKPDRSVTQPPVTPPPQFEPWSKSFHSETKEVYIYHMIFQGFTYEYSTHRHERSDGDIRDTHRPPISKSGEEQNWVCPSQMIGHKPLKWLFLIFYWIATFSYKLQKLPKFPKNSTLGHQNHLSFEKKLRITNNHIRTKAFHHKCTTRSLQLEPLP